MIELDRAGGRIRKLHAAWFDVSAEEAKQRQLGRSGQCANQPGGLAT
jgi:hypothetical protein